MQILVTGSAGFVGKNLVSHLKENQVEVIGLDKEPMNGDLCYRLGSFEKDFKDFFLNYAKGVEAIIHLASESHVDRSISGPKQFIDNNVNGTLELFELCRKLPNLKTIILFSTDEVGACLEEGSFFEQGQGFKCGSVYSASKGAQELLAQAYINTHNLPIITTRCVNIFGPHQSEEKFLPKIIKNALQNQAIPVYGSGMQMRQWVYVEHICKVLNTIATANFIPHGTILHIGGTREIYNMMFAQTVLGMMGKSFELLKHVEDRLGHDERYSLGVSEETNRFYIEEYDQKNFLVDLKKTVSWYLNQ